VDGNVLYYIPYAPALVTTISASEIDPEVKEQLVGYIVSYASRGIIARDLTTGEERTIATPGLDPRGIRGIADGKLDVYGTCIDRDKVVEHYKGYVETSPRMWKESFRDNVGVGFGEFRFVEVGTQTEEK
jgi:hypothetical protein